MKLKIHVKIRVRASKSMEELGKQPHTYRPNQDKGLQVTVPAVLFHIMKR